MTKYDVIIVGGGASGMMAAISAAIEGKKVLLLEKMKQLGKKLLVTGNGKCNFTNDNQEISCYHSDMPEAVGEVLAHFGTKETKKLFLDWGVLSLEKNGCCYPVTGQASTVLHSLIRQLEKWQVDVRTDARVSMIQETRQHTYEVSSAAGVFSSSSVIISTGGMAAPKTGSTGDAYYWLKLLGCRQNTPIPALSPCQLKGDFMSKWAGVRAIGTVKACTAEGTLLSEDEGELQFVHYGISGIPVFQISHSISCELEKGGHPLIYLDLLPAWDVHWVYDDLLHRQKQFGTENGMMALDGLLHQNLVETLLYVLGMDATKKVSCWSDTQIRKLAEKIKNWKLGVKKVAGFEKAQVTCGGILLSSISPKTMEVKNHPGLYITGELLNVDGICGGYNLQWAWSSGFLAGKAAAHRH